MKTIAFFNNKGGVGKTSLVYHLACIYADLGVNVIAADFDPQANLTGMFLPDERLEELWGDEQDSRNTVHDAIRPLLEGSGDVAAPYVEEAVPGVGLLAGDPALSSVEDELSSPWPDCLDRKPRAFRLLSALRRTLRIAADENAASLVLVDTGPNLGAFNRAALATTDYVIVPLAPDRRSLRGLQSLGAALNRWRREWRERDPVRDLEISEDSMRPIGYVVLRHDFRLDRSIMAHERWLDHIPKAYREAVAGEAFDESMRVEDDVHCLAALKPFRSLVHMAQEARKPMFRLKPADGAMGSHARAVQDCYRDFRDLARTVADRAGVALP